jgi:hypothetical protein
MRGADPVDDEFEVGFNSVFENRWYRAEQIGRVVMVAFVAAALAGLLGRGPYSHAHAHTPDGAVRVDYEPVARYATPTQITLHLSNMTKTAQTVSVFLSSHFIEPMGMSQANPRPESAEAVEGGLTLRFRIAAWQPDALVRLNAQPSAVGPVPLWVQAGAAAPLRWTQFIVP